MPAGHHRCEDADLAGVLREADQGRVELQLVDQQPLDGGEGGRAPAKVVDADADTDLAQLGQHGRRARVGCDSLLVDRDGQEPRLRARFLQDPAERRCEPRQLQRAGAELDGDAQTPAFAIPLADLAGGEPDNLKVHLRAEPRHLCDGQEGCGLEEPSRGVIPTHQCVHAADSP